jgi:hypothetical protein
MRAACLTVAVTLLAGSSLARASDSDAQVLREARDRAEIEQLMWRYVRALDTLDADAYAATYTPDGRFGSGSNAAQGTAALKKMIADVKQRQAERAAKGGPKQGAMYHAIANSWLEFVDHDHARLHSYRMTMFAAAEPGGQPRVAAVGHSVDELVRTGGHWLIHVRDVAPKD